jgi:hypothetical protein
VNRTVVHPREVYILSSRVNSLHNRGIHDIMDHG